MSIGPKEIAVFVIDCSKSMAIPVEFTVQGITSLVNPITVMLKYTKAKIAQRIMRDLKTTPLAVIAYAVPKTKNVLTAQKKAELGQDYDKSDDAYRHYYDVFGVSFVPEGGMIGLLDQEIHAGLGPDATKGDVSCADLHTAIILALETITKDPKAKNYKKDIYLMTDGESETDWDGWESTLEQMNLKGVALNVIGMDFQDEDEDEEREDDLRSETRKNNELHLRQMVEKLTADSIFASAADAMNAIATPAIREVNSYPNRLLLSLGDPDVPDKSIRIHVEVKKAVSAASVKSMKKMSTWGFQKVEQAAAAAQAAKDKESQSQRMSFGGSGGETSLEGPSGLQAYLMGNIGRTYMQIMEAAGLQENKDDLDSDLQTHNVVRETRHFYRPIEVDETNPVKKEGEEEDEETERQENALRPTGDAELTDAYYYGGSLIPTGDMEDGTGMLTGNKMSMEIICFMKKSEIHFDWRLNDLNYVYAAPGQTGSQLMLSALIHGMNERGSVAIVRYIGKGMTSSKTGVFKVPDPKVGILFPVIDTPREFCYWCQMPFAEDIRALSFPSLKNLFNRKGVRLEEHKFLPTKPMNDAMEEFVESMELTRPPEEVEEEGGDPTYFDVSDSFSPAIHNIQNTLIFRLTDDGDLPPVPHVLTKYLDPPPVVLERAESAKRRAIDAFDVKLVPPKPKKITKKSGAVMAEDQSEIQFDRLFGSGHIPSTSQYPATAAKEISYPSSTIPTKPHNPYSQPRMNVDEDEDSKEGIRSQTAPQSTQLKNASVSPVKALKKEAEDDEPDTEDEEPATEDEGEAPARLAAVAGVKISETSPLDDFDKVLKAHGINSAIEATFPTVVNLVKSSFSNANYQIAIDLLLKARYAAEDKSPAASQAFSKRLSGLRSTLEGIPKKRDFIQWIEKEDFEG
ncbi:SPOC domain-like protein [Meredithblackwellia eburnea MCA 4105]